MCFCRIPREQKVEVFAGVAQAATQTTPENERVSFVAAGGKPKNKMSLKSRSNSKNGTMTDPADSSDAKDGRQQEAIVQEPK